MKRVLITLFALFAFAATKAQTGYYEYEGQVYYDSAKKNLKEVYHYYLQYKYTVSYSRGDTTINPTPVAVRHGSCIFYRIDGSIEATGQYKDGRKTGQWLYYDDKGKKVLRKESFG